MKKRVKKALNSIKKVIAKAVSKPVRKRSRRSLKQTSLKPNRSRRNLFKTINLQNQPHPEIFPVPTARESRPADRNGFELPSRYGDNKIVLLVRDPWWIYAYWEVAHEREQEVLRQIQKEGLTRERTVLRVYDVTGTVPPKSHSFFDIELSHFADNWYIDVGAPDREWVAELGVRTREGRYFCLVRSNTVRTPRYGISDVIDEEWMIPDDLYWKIIDRATTRMEFKSARERRREGELYRKQQASSE